MKKIQIFILSVVTLLGIACIQPRFNIQTIAAVVSKPTAPQVVYTEVNPLTVISNPYKYLNTNIKFKAKFDKYTTLGLDYPPALRDHDKYITVLIQRPDITSHNIPLSEFKIFFKKDLAEKNIDLDTGDEIYFKGKVFSTALGDPWFDTHTIQIINKVKKDTKKVEQ